MSDKKKQRKEMIGSGEQIALNRQARFNYTLGDEFEAGMELTGTEVKSLRLGRVSLNEAYVGEMEGEIYLINSNIPIYDPAPKYAQHDPKRHRKLLLHKREINKLRGAIQQDGKTIVPLKMYFNKRGIAKLLIAVGTGKQAHDKRETVKNRDWQRQKARIIRENT